MLQRQSLDLLIYHEELDQAGAQLGIGVSEKEIASRVSGSGEVEGGGTGSANDLAFRKQGIRGALLYRRIYARVTRDVSVNPREIRAYYRAHTGLYRLQGRSFKSARGSIAANLRDTKRNAAMSRWVERMKNAFARQVKYAPEFQP